MTRRRAMSAVALAAAVVWLACGLHRVPGTDVEIQTRSWLGGGGATAALRPGWALSPWPLARVRIYPATPVAVSGRWPAEGETALRSREGVAVLAAGSLVLRADVGRLQDLVRVFPEGWGREPLAPAVQAAIQRAIGDAAREQAASTPFTELLQPEGGPAGTTPPMVDRLASHLSRQGVKVQSAKALKFYPLSRRGPVARASSSSSGGHRVMIVGLDGADWDVIDPLMARGGMPNLKRLVDGGVRARLKTITPVLSPIIWTSIATGVGPEKHGIIDFLATSKTTGNQIPVTSNMRRVKALWNMLSESGQTSGIVAWWATWPAEEVNGFIVSDRVAFQLFGYPESGENLRRKTYPEGLALAIQPLVVAPAQVTPDELRRILPGGALPGPEGEELVRKLRTILASARTYTAISLDLMSAYDPDLKAVYFEGTDTIAHNFMRYRPPALAGVTAAEVAAYGDVVDRFYEYQDELLGKVMALAGEDTVVIVCSDHGFRSGTNRPATDPRVEMGGAADWHRKFGVLVMQGPGVRKGATLEDVSVMDIAPTVLAVMGLPVGKDMGGQVLATAMVEAPATRVIASWSEPGNEPGSESGQGRTGGAGAPPDSEPLGSAIDEEIIAKLTALGYVSQEGSNALNNSGITLMDRGRYTEAAEVFRRALAQDPRFVHARINLGRAQMLMKDFDGAIKSLQEALRLDPRQVEVDNLLGNIYMERGDPARAEAAFRKSLAARPDDTNAHNSLGLLYDRIGKDELAIQEYRKVVAIDPDYAEGYNNIGLIYRKRGEPRKAIELFEQAIKADADFPGSYNNMGLAWQDLGDLKQARLVLERGLTISPKNAVILNNLGTIDLAEHDLAAAKSRFAQAIEADPEYPSAYNNLGAVLGMMGKPDDAFEEYLKAVELDPNYADARFNIARHFAEQHRIREAIDMLDKVLAIDPRYAKALLQVGILLAQQGKLDLALRRVGQAATEMPSSPDPHNLMADIYLSQGRFEEAKKELRKSLMLKPEQPRVRETLERME